MAAADLARVPMPSHNVYRDRLLGAIAHGDGIAIMRFSGASKRALGLEYVPSQSGAARL